MTTGNDPAAITTVLTKASLSSTARHPALTRGNKPADGMPVLTGSGDTTEALMQAGLSTADCGRPAACARGNRVASTAFSRRTRRELTGSAEPSGMTALFLDRPEIRRSLDLGFRMALQKKRGNRRCYAGKDTDQVTIAMNIRPF